MIFFVLNTFLVFELNEKFNFTYEHTCRIASIVHALFCIAGSTLYLTERITLEQVDPIINYNAIYITTDLILYLTNAIKDNISRTEEKIINKIIIFTKNFSLGELLFIVNTGI